MANDSIFHNRKVGSDYVFLPWDRSHILITHSRGIIKTDNPPKFTDEEKEQLRIKTTKRAYFLRLSAPVAVSGTLEGTINYKGVTMYPPFATKEERILQVFRGVPLPEPDGSITEIPDFFEGRLVNKLGVDAPLFHGVRLDVEDDFALIPQLDYILGLIREQTFQWWLRTDRNPFDAGISLYARIHEDGTTYSKSFEDNYGRDYPWNAAFSGQSRVGFEIPLESGGWKRCIASAKVEKPLESATTFTLNAVSSYFANRHESFIIECCIALEIMESKVRTLHGSPSKKYGERLLFDAKLWDSADSELLKKLFRRRGHVAHGRSISEDSRDAILEQNSAELLFKYYRKFISTYGQSRWDEISRL